MKAYDAYKSVNRVDDQRPSPSFVLVNCRYCELLFNELSDVAKQIADLGRTILTLWHEGQEIAEADLKLEELERERARLRGLITTHEGSHVRLLSRARQQYAMDAGQRPRLRR